MSEKYDPKCERLDVAIKAIWRCYRFGRWTWLESLGFDRGMHEPLFQEFDARYITSDHGLIYQRHHIKALLHFFGPFLVERACELLERYALLTQASRKRYYGL